MSGIEVVPNFNSGKITVANWCDQIIYVRVTTYTTRGGSVDYFPINPRGEETWGRGEENGYEGVFISRGARGFNLSGCLYVKNGSKLMVRDCAALPRPYRLNSYHLSYQTGEKPIAVQNRTNEPVKVFVSSFSQSKGDESWFDIGPGCTETWNRPDTELVVVTRASEAHDRSKRVGTWLNRGEVLVIG